MRYLPHTEEDVRQMLAAIGVASVEDLFCEVPAAVRLARPLQLPEAAGRERPAARAAPARRPQRHRRRPSLFSRRRRLQPLHPRGGRPADLAQRILHRLHPLPAGDQPGDAAGDLRVPDPDLPADRDGSGQRLHVRRRLGLRGRSAARGPRHPAQAGAALRRAAPRLPADGGDLLQIPRPGTGRSPLRCVRGHRRRAVAGAGRRRNRGGGRRLSELLRGSRGSRRPRRHRP